MGDINPPSRTNRVQNTDTIGEQSYWCSTTSQKDAPEKNYCILTTGAVFLYREYPYNMIVPRWYPCFEHGLFWMEDSFPPSVSVFQRTRNTLKKCIPRIAYRFQESKLIKIDQESVRPQIVAQNPSQLLEFPKNLDFNCGGQPLFQKIRRNNLFFFQKWPDLRN